MLAVHSVQYQSQRMIYISAPLAHGAPKAYTCNIFHCALVAKLSHTAVLVAANSNAESEVANYVNLHIHIGYCHNCSATRMSSKPAFRGPI